MSSATNPGSGAATAAAPAHLSPARRVWARFRRNRLAVLGAWFLAALVLLVTNPVTLYEPGVIETKRKVPVPVAGSRT